MMTPQQRAAAIADLRRRVAVKRMIMDAGGEPAKLPPEIAREARRLRERVAEIARMLPFLPPRQTN